MLASIRRRCPWLPAAVLLGAALAVVPAAFGKSPVPAYPAKAKVGGLKPAAWVGQWFQWYYSIPLTSHPVQFNSGDYTSIGQRGPVWFLCPGFATNAVTRNITVPAGVSLFFPIKYSETDNAGQIPSAYMTVDEMYAVVKANVDAVDITGYFCKVSFGKVEEVSLTDLAKRRIKSSAFSYGVGPGTVPTLFVPAPDVADMVSPAVSDGYWVMLKPLPVGTHTVEYGRDTANSGVDWTLTYNITVVAPQE